MSSVIADPPTSDIDLFSDAILADPYEAYRELREMGPVVYLERQSVWAVPRFAGVTEVLRDWEGFTSSEGVALSDFGNARKGEIMVATDPPVHDRLRRVLSDRLSTGAVRGLAAFVGSQADDLVGELAERGEFDAVEDLAAIFPITVVADLIGLPAEGRENLIDWGSAVFDTFGPENERTASAIPLAKKLAGYLEEVATRERLTPGSMGMSVYEAADRGEIDAQSCIPLMSAYVVAGMDTTVNAIGSAILHLGEHPDQWQELRDDPGLVRSAGNEILRFDSPVQAFARVTTAAQEVEGFSIPAGERVVPIFGSANRDEQKWEDADSFRVKRNPIGHLAFGFGIHRCAGAGLARLEIEAVLAAFTRSVKEIEIVGEPVRLLNNTTRGLRSLPISVVPK